MYKTLLMEKQNNIARITLNRPDILNALSKEMLEDLKSVFDEIRKDDSLKAVILTGEGRAFAAGADISQMVTLSGTEGQQLMKQGAEVMDIIENFSIPVIAAVNGYALGGGCELAMACDIRIASEKAMFGQPEVNLGIIPGFGGTQRLPRLVGKGMGKYLIMSGDSINAGEAMRIGLVEKVVPHNDLISECICLTEKIASKGPIAIRAAKFAINKGIMMDMDAALSLENETCLAPFCSEDRHTGMSAFLGKYKADFKNR